MVKVISHVKQKKKPSVQINDIVQTSRLKSSGRFKARTNKHILLTLTGWMHSFTRYPYKFNNKIKLMKIYYTTFFTFIPQMVFFSFLSDFLLDRIDDCCCSFICLWNYDAIRKPNTRHAGQLSTQHDALQNHEFIEKSIQFYGECNSIQWLSHWRNQFYPRSCNFLIGY